MILISFLREMLNSLEQQRNSNGTGAWNSNGTHNNKGNKGSTNKTDKKDNNTKSPSVDSTPSKHKHGEFKKVLLLDDEYSKLIKKFGEVDAKERIERLDIYIGSNKKGKNYKDHYLTILSWARKDEKNQTNKPMTRAEISDDNLKKWVGDYE